MNKFDTFEAIVNVLDVDIISVTESWATPQILDTEISLCSYQLFRSDRNSPNKGGSVLLLCTWVFETCWKLSLMIMFGVK